VTVAAAIHAVTLAIGKLTTRSDVGRRELRPDRSGYLVRGGRKQSDFDVLLVPIDSDCHRLRPPEVLVIQVVEDLQLQLAQPCPPGRDESNADGDPVRHQGLQVFCCGEVVAFGDTDPEGGVPAIVPEPGEGWGRLAPSDDDVHGGSKRYVVYRSVGVRGCTGHAASVTESLSRC
jgi:hypothetical protein